MSPRMTNLQSLDIQRRLPGDFLQVSDFKSQIYDIAWLKNGNIFIILNQNDKPLIQVKEQDMISVVGKKVVILY